METIISSMKSLVVAISATFLALFGAGTHEITPAVPEATSTPEIAVVEPVATNTPITTATPEPKNSHVQAYELGKAIGALEEQVRNAERQLKAVQEQQSKNSSTSTQNQTELPLVNPNQQVIPTSSPIPTQSSPAPQPEPTSQPLPVQNETPMSQASIEIISPIPGKGLGRKYTAQPEIYDESNYIELGLVVRGDNGDVRKDIQVTITATDSSQNKTHNGTGNQTKVYKNGEPSTVYYYPFHYEFKTAGKHTITFTTADGMTASVDVEVSEPDPA